MWFRSTVLLVALAGAALPFSIAAQSSPRDAAARFLDAWNTRRWSDAARLLDLDQFDRFRQDFISRARRSSSEGPQVTVEELRRTDPDMPREVAEYQVRQMEEQQRRYADPTPFEFARVTSISALRALTPEEAAARWLESRDPQWQVKMQFEQAGCPAPDDLDEIVVPRRRVVGVVGDGDSLSYAVFREERTGDETPAWAGGDVSVLELKLRRGRWLVSPRADLLPEVGQVDVSSCRKAGNRD
jgi:hypothetical protein